jgi:hypothetical protein
MGIDEFNEFPLLVPHLVDDPFASLSTADLTTMEVASAEDGDSSQYVDDG